jgi:hypothetical protein
MKTKIRCASNEFIDDEKKKDVYCSTLPGNNQYAIFLFSSFFFLRNRAGQHFPNDKFPDRLEKP